jgi:hypothetical protein
MLDAVTVIVEPNLNDGTLLEVATWLLEHEHCVITAAKFVDLLSDARKSVFLKVEAAVVSCVGIQIKKAGRALEVDGYSQITGFKDLLLKATLEDPLSAPGLWPNSQLSQPQPPLCRPRRLLSPRCPSRNGRSRGGKQQLPTPTRPSQPPKPLNSR